jgi:hypothetical protein
VGSEQLDRADVGVTDDSYPSQAQHTAAQRCAIERWLSRVFDLASGQPKARQPSIPGHNAFLQQAIRQLKPDIRSEVLQVKLANDPGPPKPHPVRINVRREPPTQDIANYARPAGPGLAPRQHRRLINRLIIGGQVEPFPAADMLDQQLLHRG